MISAERKLVGEGRLGWIDALGGPGAVFPFVVAVATVVMLGLWYPPLEIALGALVPIWLGWRMRIPHGVLNVARRGRPAFRIVLDDVGVRTFDAAGRPVLDLEWFELERFQVADHALALVMRVAKNGTSAVVVPKAFFSPNEWLELLALVREKLPGAAKEIDAAKADADARVRRGNRPVLVLGMVLLVISSSILWLLRDRW